MKLTLLSTLAIAAVVSARAIVKRSDASEVASVGFATLNGGTTGGAGGSTVSVSSLSDLQDAASADGAAIILVTSPIEGNDVVNVASDKTIIGVDSSVSVGIRIKDVSNVIIRNIVIKEVLAETGDALAVQAANNVWVDHVDLSSNMDHDKDYYDGLFDVTHAADYVTITNSFLHDHWKASLVGHSDSNGDEDTGHLTLTFANNFFYNLNSRGPSYRFGTGHLFNNYYDTVNDGINTRDGAQLLVENNVFSNCGDKALYAVEGDGYAVASGNDFGDSENTAPEGTLSASDLGYDYTLLDTSEVYSAVYGTAGVTLTFSA